MLRDDVQSFLNEIRFGVLGTVNVSGSPQQTVMWYELRGDTIMMNTLRGRRKDRNLLRDPRASLCVEDGQRYVTIEGSIEMIEEREPAQADITALAKRYEGPVEGDRLGRDVFGSQERVSLIMQITKVDVHGFDGEG